MKKNRVYFSIVFLSISVIAIAAAFIFFQPETKTVTAGINPAVHNVWGWAWNDTIGWISFNAANCNTDGDANYEGSGESRKVPDDNIPGGGAAPSGCPSTGTVYDYGVLIGKNGKLNNNAYAWNDVKGGLRLDPPGPYPTNPQSSTTIDFATRKFSGWARFCALASNPATCTGGTAGWVKMAGTTQGGIDYGVSLDNANNFSGYAYSEDADIQYISFNSQNCDTDNDGHSNGGTDCPAAGVAMGRYFVSMNTNVWGYAWSSNIGYISMNCANASASECGGGHFYGVNITSYDANYYQMRGYGWSPNVGWINFSPSSGYPSAPLNSVRIDKITGTTTGWAKIESLGNNGWIKMSDDTAAGWKDLPVKISYATYPQRFNGYAWNAAAATGPGIGWISFASSTPGAGGGDYEVYSDFNTPPQVIVGESDLTTMNPCLYVGADHVLGYHFDWTYYDIEDGNNQFGYELEIKLSTQPWGTDVYYKKVECPTAGCDTTLDNFSNNDLPSDNIEYGRTYNWRVRVKDSVGMWSAWSNVFTRTTIAHQYPHPKFSWFIENPSAAEEVKFTNLGTEFKTGGNSELLCDDTTPTCTFHWAVSPASTISDDTASSTRITFPERGTYTVTLDVTDGDVYTCSTSTQVNPTYRLPTWRESR